MSYTVKEIFYTLQGEGANVGRPAVFLRFAGCNLWSGLEENRATAICRFCDTDFVGTDGPGGGKFATAESLARAVAGQWPRQVGRTFLSFPVGQEYPTYGGGFVVCTGGEPLLQLDAPLIAALHEQGFESAIERNGTRWP